MPLPLAAVAGFAALLAFAQGSSGFVADPPMVCSSCDEWNRPIEPFNLFGNTWFVGTAGLGAVLITSDAGSILIDGGLPQTAPLINANIRKLGFRTEDIRLIVTSHEHYDHVGGVSALQRASGARVAASRASAQALEAGLPTPADPQYAFGRDANGYPAVKEVRVIADGEVLRVGPLAVTAHFTPGHTPGSTTWSWQSCDGSRCLNLVYADSLNAVSADGFLFTGDRTHGSLIPAFRRSIDTIAALPCDIVIAVHPMLTDMEGKLNRRRAGASPDPFIDAGGCRDYAAAARTRLDARVASETAR